ncbi:MAG: DUF6717 family protein [Verrucomicrobiota bacterium]
MDLRFAILLSLFLLLTDCSRETPTTSPSNNALMVIRPYFKHGTWVFDDASKKLKEEPFVAGVPEILTALVADIPNAKEGFRLTFSAKPFPGHELVTLRGKAESGGYWYSVEGLDRKGWLCPALFNYYEEAPARIYIKADAIETE